VGAGYHVPGGLLAHVRPTGQANVGREVGAGELDALFVCEVSHDRSGGI